MKNILFIVFLILILFLVFNKKKAGYGYGCGCGRRNCPRRAKSQIDPNDPTFKFYPRINSFSI
jgi:hypothetical protein